MDRRTHLAGSREVNAAYAAATEAYERARANARPGTTHHADTYLELGDSYRDDLELELFEAPGLQYLGEAAQSAGAHARAAVLDAKRLDAEDRAWARRVQGQRTRAANNMFMQNVRGASRFDGLGHSEPTHRSFTRMNVNSAIHSTRRTAALLAAPTAACKTILKTHIEAIESLARASDHKSAGGEPNYATAELDQAREAITANEPLVFARCVNPGTGVRG